MTKTSQALNPFQNRFTPDACRAFAFCFTDFDEMLQAKACNSESIK